MTNHQTNAQAILFLRTRPGSFGFDPQAQQHQLAAQRDVCRQIADHLGLAVIREYAESGGTGPISRRPQLRLLLEELRTLRDASYVIVAHLDRLTRTMADCWTIELELEAAGAKLIIASQLLTTCTDREEVTA
jgi:DNA invertase Pin-like site-specific DNA recombinase